VNNLIKEQYNDLEMVVKLHKYNYGVCYMGRDKMIYLMFLVLFIAIVIISPWNRNRDALEMDIEQKLYSEVRKVGNYALNYAVSELLQNNITLGEGLVTQSFTDFTVMKGAVDSIKYYSPTMDTITVTAYVFARESKKELYHESKVIIAYQPMLVSPEGVTNAITTDGFVEIKGSTDIEGEVSEQDTSFVFEEIFGYTKDEIKNCATHYYVDPENNITPVDNVTWMEFDMEDEFKVSHNTWEGSGIMIINGDTHISGGYFEGIIWVIGDCFITGNPHIEGALFIEGESDMDTSTITGNPIVNFNSGAVSSTYSLMLGGSQYQIIAWYE